MRRRLALALAIPLSILSLAACGGQGGGQQQGPAPVNFGPKALEGKAVPAVPDKSLDRKALSVPKARPPHDLVPVKG
jgi:hypothetical protein